MTGGEETMASESDLEKLGAAQAAILAAMLGTLSLAVVHLGTEMSAGFKKLVESLGKAWMPGAEGIGPYAGKETVMAVVWLTSWYLLHLWLRKKEWNQNVVFTAFLAGLALATTLLWPPVTHWAVHLLK